MMRLPAARAKVLLLATWIWLLTPAPHALGQAPHWATLPPTPALPKADQTGYAAVNGIKLWYAAFGHGQPVIFLHGGLANADYWGLQVPAVAQQYRVIVMDSRGHGRSSRDDCPYSYDLLADDVIGLLDSLGIRRAAVVGWSDGGIIGLDLAMRYPARVAKVFAFGANTDPSGVIAGGSKNPIFAAFLTRVRLEYRTRSPTPENYDEFVAALRRMWAMQPNWTPAQLHAIKTAVEVADGDHDEIIERRHTMRIAAAIPGASLVILPNTSHFALLQDPAAWTRQILRFLASPSAQPAAASQIVHHGINGEASEVAP